MFKILAITPQFKNNDKLLKQSIGLAKVGFNYYPLIQLENFQVILITYAG